MVDHIGHGMEKLAKFCEERKKEVLDQISFGELSTRLEFFKKELCSTKTH